MATATETLTAGNVAGDAAAASVPTKALPGADFKPASWADSVKDPDVQSWLKNKNYPDAEHALQAHRNLESLFGADKAGRTVLLPKDENDVEGWKALTAKLGVPEKPDDYKLPMPEGVDDGFAKTAAQWFHEAGVPPRAATKIAERWNAWVQEQVKVGEEADKAQAQKDTEALMREWGPRATEYSELARRGFRDFGKQFGLDDKGIERMESVVGSANLLKFFHGLGSLNSEHSFAGSNDGNGGFKASASAAQKQIDEITAKRMKGEINDYQWEKEYGPQLEKLFQQVARAG